METELVDHKWSRHPIESIWVTAFAKGTHDIVRVTQPKYTLSKVPTYIEYIYHCVTFTRVMIMSGENRMLQVSFLIPIATIALEKLLVSWRINAATVKQN